MHPRAKITKINFLRHKKYLKSLDWTVATIEYMSSEVPNQEFLAKEKHNNDVSEIDKIVVCPVCNNSITGVNGLAGNNVGSNSNNNKNIVDPVARYTLKNGLMLSINPCTCCCGKQEEVSTKKVFSFNLHMYLVGAFIVAIIWFIVWAALPKKIDDSSYNDQLALPGGLFFDIFIAIMVNFFVGTILCENILGIPVVVGVLWSAIAYNHIPSYGFLTKGIDPRARHLVGQCGLSVILARAGFSISWNLIRKNLVNVMALSVVPQFVEGISHAGMAYYMFAEEFAPVGQATDEAWKWAMLQGFLGSVISTGIVAPGMLHLLNEGYTCPPTPIVLSAVGIDTAMGVWTVTFILSLFSDYTGGRSVLLSSVLGPIQLIVGALIGAGIGFVFVKGSKILRKVLVEEAIDTVQSVEPSCYCSNNQITGDDEEGVDVSVSVGEEVRAYDQATQTTKIATIAPNTTTFDRVLFVLFLGIVLSAVLLGQKVGLAGGGTVMNLAFAASVSHFLELEVGPHSYDKFAQTKQMIAANLAFIWNNIMVGCVFTMTGVSVPLSKVFSGSFFPRCIACIGVASVFRILASGVCVLGTGCNANEIGFVTMAWLGKAAVQAAMNSIAVDRAMETLVMVSANHSESSETNLPVMVAQQQLHAAKTVQRTAVLYIMLAAPICAVFISKFGPVLLRKPNQ
eukprot:Tbor_TRINITY_DN5074_c0_g1::TRINITY_DN5074_c0_g1_i1::g.14395::m.14395